MNHNSCFYIAIILGMLRVNFLTETVKRKLLYKNYNFEILNQSYNIKN